MFTASDDKKRNNTSDKGNSNLNLSNSLDTNLTLFHNILSKNDTAQFRNFEINIGPTAKCCLVFIGSMVNVTIINDNILKPLMLSNIEENIEIGALPDYLLNKIITTHEASKSIDIDKLIGSILYGDCILLIDGISEGLIIGSKGWQTRQVILPLLKVSLEAQGKALLNLYKLICL